MILDIDKALVEKFQPILESIQPKITTEKYAFSLVDDQENDFILMEKNRRSIEEEDELDISRVKFPFIILQRGQLKHRFNNNHGSTRFANQVVISKDTGTGDAVLGWFATVDIEYFFRWYDDSTNRLTDLEELWMMRAGRLGYTQLDFESVLIPGENLRASMAFDNIRKTAITLREERKKGNLYMMELPIIVTANLISDIHTGDIILETIVNITTKKEL